MEMFHLGGRFYNTALQQANLSKYKNYRLGAVALNKGKTLSKGYNTAEVHGRLKQDYGYFAGHAEANALRGIEKCDTLVVIRVRRDGKLSCSRPCFRCMQYIKDKGVKWIIYTDWDGSFKKMKV